MGNHTTTIHRLARTAFRSTGTNPDRKPSGDDKAAAAHFVATQMAEEIADLSQADIALYADVILHITKADEE